jgi:hypothetical protein
VQCQKQVEKRPSKGHEKILAFGQFYRNLKERRRSDLCSYWVLNKKAPNASQFL